MTPAPPLRSRLHRTARGYFAFPLLPHDQTLEDYGQWQICARHVEAAKHGRFDDLSTLLEVYADETSWVRRSVYVRLMGAAAPMDLIVRIHALLHSDIPYDCALGFMEALFYAGRLDTIPTVIEGWRLIHTEQDGVYIPPRLSLLLQPEMRSDLDCPGADASDAEADAFRDEMLERHAALRDEYGERAFVFRGRLLDLEWIIRCALADLATGTIDSQMRHKIEAMTGIDCSCFYHREALQPLAAAALLEDMLASLDLFPFVPGQRYFFGHPVP